MATTREIEIGENLRKKGYSDNQIVAAIKYRREKQRVDAINRQNAKKREEYLEAELAKNDVTRKDSLYWNVFYKDGPGFIDPKNIMSFSGVDFLQADKKVDPNNPRDAFKLNEDGSVETTLMDGTVVTKTQEEFEPWNKELYKTLKWEKDEGKYRPILNEETQEYEWHNVKDGNIEKAIVSVNLDLNQQYPNLANKYQDTEFKVIDGKWHKKGNDNQYVEISELEVTSQNVPDEDQIYSGFSYTESNLVKDLDLMYPTARTDQADPKLVYTHNNVEVHRRHKIEKRKEKNEERQKVSMEDFYVNEYEPIKQKKYDEVVKLLEAGNDLDSILSLPDGDMLVDAYKNVQGLGGMFTHLYEEYTETGDYAKFTIPGIDRTFVGNQKDFLNKYYAYQNQFNVDTDGTALAPYYEDPNMFELDEESGIVKIKEQYEGLDIRPSQEKGYTKKEFENKILVPWQQKRTSTDRGDIDNYWKTESKVSVNNMIDVFGGGDASLTSMPDAKPGKYKLNDGSEIEVTADDINNYRDYIDYKNEVKTDNELKVIKQKQLEDQLSKAEQDYKNAYNHTTEEWDIEKRDMAIANIKSTGLVSNVVKGKEAYLSQYNRYLQEEIVDGKRSGKNDEWMHFYSPKEMLDYRNKIVNDINSGNLTSWTEEENKHLKTNNLSYSVDEHGLFSVEEIELMDGDQNADDVLNFGIDDFRSWYTKNKLNQNDVFLKRRQTTIDKNGNFVLTRGGDRGGDNMTWTNRDIETWKKQTYQEYTAYKFNSIHANREKLEGLNVLQDIEDIETLSKSAENIGVELKNKEKEYKDITSKLESGELEKSKDNINLQNSLANELNELVSDYTDEVGKLNGILSDEYVMDNIKTYSKVGDQYEQFKKNYLKGTLAGESGTTWGGEIMSEYEAGQKKLQYAKDHPYLNSAGDFLEAIPNLVSNFFTGTTSTMAWLYGNGMQALGRDISDEEILYQMGTWTNLQDDNLEISHFDTGDFVKENGDINWFAAPGALTTTVGNIYLMASGGGAISKGSAAVLSRGGKVVDYINKAGRFSKTINLAGSKSYKIASSLSAMGGSLPVLMPGNLRSAMSKIDENFTASDALRYSTQASLLEASIEMINPDFKMLKRVKNFKAKDALNWKLWKDGSNLDKMKYLFKQSLKEVPSEMLEENLQLFTSGVLNMHFNNKYAKDFHIPTSRDYKETAILTPLSVMIAGAGRTKGFTKGNMSAIYAEANRDFPNFKKELDKARQNGDITNKEYTNILGTADAYRVANESLVDTEWFRQMDAVDQENILNEIARKNLIQTKLDNPDTTKEEVSKLKEELKEVNGNIKDIGGNVIAKQSSQDVRGTEMMIDYLTDLLRDTKKYPPGSKEQKALIKNKVDAEKALKEFKAKAPGYEFNGNVYETRESFLEAINQARESGWLQEGKRANIKVRYDLDAIDMAYKAMGEFAPQYNPSEQVVMSNADVLSAENFLNNPNNVNETIESLQSRLNELEEANKDKEKPKDLDKITDLKEAIKYLKLKEQNKIRNEKGFIVGPVKIDYETYKEETLKRNVKAAQDLADKAGVQTFVGTNKEIMAKFGKAADGANGFFTDDTDMKTGDQAGFFWVINTDVAKGQQAFAVGTHEALHGILYSLLNGPTRFVDVYDVNGELIDAVGVKLTAEGKKLIEGFLEIIGSKSKKILDNKLAQGGYLDPARYRLPEGAVIPVELYMEEYLNMYHEAVINDGTISPRSTWKKITAKFKQIFNKGSKVDIVGESINSSEKLMEFIEGYNQQALDGKFSDDIKIRLENSLQAKIQDQEYDRQADIDDAGTLTRSQSKVQQEVDALMTPQTAAELAAEVNDIYNDDRFTDGQKEMMIAAKYRGMAEVRWDVAHRESIGKSSQKILETYKDDIISEILFDLGTKKVDEKTGKKTGRKARTVVGLVRDFKKEKHKYENTAAYINTFFKVRAFEIFAEFTKDKGFTRSMDDAMNEVSQMEDVSSEIDEAAGIQSGGIVVSKRLIEAEKGTDRESRIKQHVSNLNDIINNNPEIAEGKNYKSLPDLDPRGTISMMMSDPTAVYKDDGTPVWQRPAMKKLIGTSILDSIVEKLANNANLNQQDIKALQQYISKHNQLLWIGLPQGFTTRRVKQRDGSFIDRPDKATGVQNVLLEPFYNKAAKPYGNFFPQYKKPSMPTNDFLEVFGITPRREVNIVGKESNVSQRVKALITQHGKIISNQTVRQNENTTDAVRNSLQDGKSMPMYSITIAQNQQELGSYINAVGIMDRTIPWGKIDPTNLKDKKSPDYLRLKDLIKEALVEAVVDPTLHTKVIADTLGPTGLVINTINLRNSYKGNSKTIPSITQQALDYYDLLANTDREILNSLGLEGTLTDIANQEDVVISQRKGITDQVINLMGVYGMDVDNESMSLKQAWETSTQEQRENVIREISKTKGQYSSMGRIVNGYWTLEEEGGKPIRNTEFIPGKVNRKQTTEGIGDWAALVNQAIPGVTIIPVMPASKSTNQPAGKRNYNGKTRARTQIRDKTTYDKNGKQTSPDGMDKLYPNFNESEIAEESKKVIENIDSSGFYTKFEDHKNQAISYREMLINQFIWLNNKYHDNNDLADDRFAAAHLMTLGSGMTSPGRKAAYPWGIADGAKDVPVSRMGKDLEYDHLKANHVLMLKMADMLKRNLTESQIRAELEVFFSDYVVNILPKKMDSIVKMNKLQSWMQLEYLEGTDLSDLSKIEQSAFGRLFHNYTRYNKEIRAITALDPSLNGLKVGEDFVNKSYHNFDNKQQLEQRNYVKKAVQRSQSINHKTPSRGMSAFDFDETLIDKGENTIIATKGDQIVEITSSQWPLQGPQLAADGFDFDFSDFINVRGGVEGPLMQKFRNRIARYGIENNYILTARPAEAAPAIQAWLKEQGIDMPIENITGLGNSTGEAKAMWMAEKFAEGYNDMYFVDDALPNVKAVADMLEELDIKGSSVQAKIQFSRTMDSKFNQALDNNFQTELDLNRILEQTKGVKAEAVFSDAQAKIRGSAKGKWKFWVPYSAEDFKGLVYRFVGKGRQGEAQMAFFKKALFDPFGRAHEAMNMSKQQLNNQYKELLKQFPDVKKDLKESLDTFDGFEGNQFTVEQAIRVYLWDKNGMEVPGLSKRDLKALVNFVQGDTEMKLFAENLALITNQELGYLEPTEYWTVENIDSDINKINNEINREDHLAEWRQNKEIMFGVWGNDGRLVGDNINKIEAIYGTRFREALEDILYRMEFGRKREAGSNRLVNAFNNWANQSVGAIMFFNMRSALLQTISSINYLNWSDNNPLKAGGALLNFPQFLKDFTMIFNSDMLKQRRAGNQRGINEAELAQAVEGVGVANRVKAMLHYLLTKGFLPTQIADSFAISSGGATFYRNRVNTYLKQGMTQEQAEARAFQDFAENTEESQQSSRADMISQQQASPLGRYILAFKNTPMQYARLTKKAFLDLANGRGDVKTNVGKIIYYMAVQNLIFSALQTALGALIGGDEDEEKEKAYQRTLNSMVDSILGGLGFGGNVALTLKNTILEYNKQEKKGWNSDHTYTILKFFGLSPTISSKGRKLYSAIQTEKYNEEVRKEMSLLDIDNPIYSIIGNIISATTNLPLDRLVKKVDNIDAALTEDITALERFALLMGWNTWDLKIDDSDVVAVEDEIKEKKKIEREKKREIKKEEKKKKEEEENKIKEEENKKKKDDICIAISKGGKRCKNKAESGGYCTVHAKVEQGTKQVQCSKIKSDGNRCKMKTKAKSGLCYYHD